MSFRFMRVILFFDLPTETLEDRRNYNRFRKYLIKSGFVMMQESVYSKLALNQVAATSIIENVKRNSPHKGMIQALAITEKQFSNIVFVAGEFQSEIITSSERFVEV